MLSLANDQLDVCILDPVADRARLGSRYCSGGYVYQITDRRLGVLLSGPGYPAEEPPPVFDGQGAPEAFRDPLWLGAATPGSPPAPGTLGLMLGVGLVRAPSQPLAHGQMLPVEEYAAWEIEESDQSPTQTLMATRQQLGGWALELIRSLTLAGRTLASETRLRNSGQEPLAFRWYPHPFYPYPAGECCKFNLPVAMPENPGYELLASGFVSLRLDHPWTRRGHLQIVQVAPGAPGERLVTLQRHPKLGLVAATCSYTPSFLPIWGNLNTFSFEPYFQATVLPGAEVRWSITYDF